jgi:glyoxylase-like metal-dependent hydrolase (beta-lactamase superfamily II)
LASLASHPKPDSTGPRDRAIARRACCPEDVRGQGDAAIVELPDGAAWFVDAGGLPSRGDLAAAAAPGKIVTRALEAYGHTAVDLAIISHPHPDHYLGLAESTFLWAQLTRLVTECLKQWRPRARA